ncbi:MAG: hypothetical protein WBG32_06475 [Nodosilinea sp.]
MPHSICHRLTPNSLLSKLGLSGLLAASIVGATPGFAATEVPTHAVTDLSEPVMVANLGNVLRDINRGAQQVQQEIQRQQRQQQRRDQEAARQRQQQEQESARQAAAEQRRLEAERQRQYFESLTPEQQQAYIAEQRARQAAQAGVMAELFILLVGSGDGGSAPASSGPDYIYVPDNSRPATQPEAPRVAPISPFYGDSHW